MASSSSPPNSPGDSSASEARLHGTKRKCDDSPDTLSNDSSHPAKQLKLSKIRGTTEESLGKDFIVCDPAESLLGRCLSEENLLSLDRINYDEYEVEFEEGGSPESDEEDMSAPRIKRKASTRSLATDTSEGLSTAAYYRTYLLTQARCYVCWNPPVAVAGQIDTIINLSLSEERKAQLEITSKTLREQFIRVAAAPGEDDCVIPMHAALQDMDIGKHLCLPLKEDWRSCLKPHVRKSQLMLPSSFLSGEEPRKRQHHDQLGQSSNMSPATSQTSNIPDGQLVAQSPTMDQEAMPPPAALPSLDSDIKTPRPDISIGLHQLFLEQKLVDAHVVPSKSSAGDFLTDLQNQQITRHLVSEPVLCSLPTVRNPDLRFPFLVLEGKSYATAGDIFVAQNQAAVSGASALKILQDLSDVAQRLDSRSPTIALTPLVFSICTQGPQLELWAHYIVHEDDVRKFCMSIVKHGHCALDTLQPFLEAVDGVLSWATTSFADGVVERLAQIYHATRPKE